MIMTSVEDRRIMDKLLWQLSESLALDHYGGVPHVKIEGEYGFTVPDIVRKYKNGYEALEVKTITENCNLMSKASRIKIQLTRRQGILPRNMSQRLSLWFQYGIWDIEDIKYITNEISGYLKSELPELLIEAFELPEVDMNEPNI